MRRAKRRAASEGRTLTALIEDGVRRVLNERAAPAKTGRILPPVSRARGGLMPGVNLDDSAALQEMDDLEHVARMK
jgi:hypothetical protein